MSRRVVLGTARWIGFALTALTAGVLIAFAAGFVRFAAHVATEEVPLTSNADGIVVLTGAATRIPDAIELLGSGRGKRLLITGVHRTTSDAEIARLTPLHERAFGCCVDLDRSALNTMGNAIETRRWVQQQGFRSLIVVTSNWHMPRALAELHHQMPDVRLISYPVLSERAKNAPWWTSTDSFRLVLSEYLKYLFALARMRVDPDFPG